MIFLRNYFVNTTTQVDVLSIIHDINRTIRESQINEGLVTVVVPAPGCAVTVIEPLPELVTKLKEALKIFPGEGEATKNRRKEDISIAPRVQAAMMGKAISLPLKDGKLVLGLREELVIIDLEGTAKRREFCVQVVGESATEKQQQQRGPQQAQRRR